MTTTPDQQNALHKEDYSESLQSRLEQENSLGEVPSNKAKNFGQICHKSKQHGWLSNSAAQDSETPCVLFHDLWMSNSPNAPWKEASGDIEHVLLKNWTSPKCKNPQGISENRMLTTFWKVEPSQQAFHFPKCRVIFLLWYPANHRKKKINCWFLHHVMPKTTGLTGVRANVSVGITSTVSGCWTWRGWRLFLFLQLFPSPNVLTDNKSLVQTGTGKGEEACAIRTQHTRF